MDVAGVELPSPLLAEGHWIDCGINALVEQGKKKGTLLHQSPYLPTSKARANEGVFAAEEPSHTPRIICFSVRPIIRCPQTPLSSKQALRDFSGSLKERTEEPLGNLNKVYRAHFAWPTF